MVIFQILLNQNIKKVIYFESKIKDDLADPLLIHFQYYPFFSEKKTFLMRKLIILHQAFSTYLTWPFAAQ